MILRSGFRATKVGIIDLYEFYKYIVLYYIILFLIWSRVPNNYKIQYKKYS